MKETLYIFLGVGVFALLFFSGIGIFNYLS